MDVFVLNDSLDIVRVVDSFNSIIWTERYSSYGDFELYLPITEENILGVMGEYRYLVERDSEYAMVIEDIQIDSDNENGAQLVVVGRSLESLLERRVVWNQLSLTGSFQNGIQTILNDNVISPEDSNRRIDIFDFEESTDEAVTSLTLDAQITRGSDVYKTIKELCDSANVGFRIRLSDDRRFKFKLFAGVDRSYEQDLNSYVIFSPSFDNLLNSSYLESKKNLKTVALVAGHGEGDERRVVSVEAPSGGGSGLDRREIYVDARDVSNTVDGETLTDDVYDTHLSKRGSTKLAEQTAIKSFEGEVDPSLTFKYGTREEVLAGTAHYSMGDIVQIQNEYGIESRSRVTELIRSESSSGFEMYPTFTKI